MTMDLNTFLTLVLKQEKLRSFLEAIYGAEALHWRKAIEEEMLALHKNKRWNLAELPQRTKAIRCKQVYKIKRITDGKPRQVAIGFAHREYMNFLEHFAPIIKTRNPSVCSQFCFYDDLELTQLGVPIIGTKAQRMGTSI